MREMMGDERHLKWDPQARLYVPPYYRMMYPSSPVQVRESGVIVPSDSIKEPLPRKHWFFKGWRGWESVHRIGTGFTILTVGWGVLSYLKPIDGLLGRIAKSIKPTVIVLGPHRPVLCPFGLAGLAEMVSSRTNVVTSEYKFLPFVTQLDTSTCIANDLTELVGKTPLLYLKKFYSCLAQVVAKLESFEPTLCICDRIVCGLINDAEERCGINPLQTVLIIPAEGDLALSVACYAAAKGYQLVILYPGALTEERRSLLVAFGAEVLHTSLAGGLAGAVIAAKELSDNTPNSFMLDMNSNVGVQASVHFRTTGPEIWTSTGGRVAAIICTDVVALVGASLFLKQQNPLIKSYVVDVPGLTWHNAIGVENCVQLVRAAQSVATGGDVGILDASVVDDHIKISYNEARHATFRLARREGLVVGIHSGAAAAAAVRVARMEQYEGKLVVVVLPTGRDYGV